MTAGLLRRLAPLLSAVLAAGASLAASWQHWINPLIDSGRELDIPLRLAAGERLYNDVAYYYGPSGPWLSASVLALTGAHWAVLQGVSLALGATVLALVYRLTRNAGSRCSAALAVTLSAAICIGAPNGGAFVFSYSSAGLLAMAGALLALDSSLRDSKSRVPLLVGALGLAVALTARAEIGLAAAAVLTLSTLRPWNGRPRSFRPAEIVGIGALVAAIIYGVACANVPLHDLISSGPLRHWVAMPPEWRTLYLSVSGLSRPLISLGSMLLGLGAGVSLLGAAALGTRFRRLTWAWIGLAPLAALLLALLAEARSSAYLPPLSAPLPLLAIVFAAGTFFHSRHAMNRARFMLFGFAALMGTRVLLGLRIGPAMTAYCALPLPLLLATASIVVIDVLAPRLAGAGEFRRRVLALASAVAILFLVRLAEQNRGLLTLRTAAGSLRLPVTQAAAVEQTLQYLATHSQPGDQLVALPEGGFFNFVSGLRSPLREEQIFPGILDPEEENSIIERLAASKPRFVLLANRPASEYGARSFGSDYAAGLWAAVEADYHLVASFGRAPDYAPVGSRRFFIRCYERTTAPPG